MLKLINDFAGKTPYKQVESIYLAIKVSQLFVLYHCLPYLIGVWKASPIYDYDA